ncbi:MAG: hypothetical protein K8R25_11840 [Methanosarcinales archaeon]|nr:hypothetical protein [Methanosarcinales archaeon]
MANTRNDIAQNEIEWNVVFSEKSRNHTISIKWNEISKLAKWPWEKEFHSISFDSQSPINSQRIRFMEGENDLSDDVVLPIKLDTLSSSTTDSSIPINLQELTTKIKFDLFSKKNIISECRFKEGRSQRKRFGEWWFEPFHFNTKLKASSIHFTLHLPELNWWKRWLFNLFKITERKYYDVIWIPYSSKYTVNVNKKGEVSLTIPEKDLSPDSEIWYILPKFNLKGSLIRLIGLISIGVAGSYIAYLLL